MSSITPIQPGFWRFDGVDIDHGFPIVGYIAASPEGLILIDPPHAPERKEELEKLGQPFACVITSAWHVRGVPFWSKEFQLPIAAPASARDELREAGAYPELILSEGYEEFGWRVLELSATPYDEVAFWNPELRTLFVGDLLVVNEEGNVAVGPNQYMQVPLEELRPILQRLAALKPKLILSSHLGPREDAQEILDTLLASI